MRPVHAHAPRPRTWACIDGHPVRAPPHDPRARALHPCMQEEHDREIRELRLANEGAAARSTATAEMRLKALDEQASNEQEELRKEAQQRIDELEQEVGELAREAATRPRTRSGRARAST